MSLMFLDGFDTYTTATDFDSVYTARNSSEIITGPNATAFARFAGAQYVRFQFATYWMQRIMPIQGAVGTTWIVGAAIYYDGPTVNYRQYPFYFQDAAANSIGLNWNDQFQLILMRNNTTVLATDATQRVLPRQWNYYEMKVNFQTSATGSVEVRLNGVSIPALTLTNVVTVAAGSGPTYVSWGGSRASDVNLFWYLDDIYVCDGTGSYNNDFLGPIRVQTLYPSAPGTYSQWNQIGGVPSNPQTAINEPYYDKDNSYLSSNTVNALSSFYFKSLLANTNAVKAVQVRSFMRKDEAGIRQVQTFLRQGSTDLASGPIITPSESYGTILTRFDNNPITAGAWVVSDVNTGEFGLKVIT